jgi:cobalt-zinc-cadmium efflux system membrane fusion protein
MMPRKSIFAPSSTGVCRNSPLAALAAALLLAPLAGCGGGAEAAPAPVDTPGAGVHRDTATLVDEAVRLAGLELARAESLPWREAWSVPARLTLDPTATHALGALAEGRVTRVLVRPGDRVLEGQLLVAMRSHELADAESAVASATAAVTEAETALSVARSAATRAERLHELRALSLGDLERARGELAQAESRRTQAGAALSRARNVHESLGGSIASTDGGEVLVRSPISGVVVSRDAQPGAVVLVGAPLVTVSRTTSLLLTMRLPERAMGAAHVGSPVSFSVAPYPDESFEARVAYVSPTLDTLTRTLEVHAQVAGDASRLRAEMFASASIMGPEGERSLIVPASAVQSFAGDTVVITASEGEGGTTIEAVRVRVGRRTAAHAEILAGLEAGTRVVTRGASVAKAEIMRRSEDE